MMSEREDYAYLALRVAGEAYGSVVDGSAPDYQGSRMSRRLPARSHAYA